MAPRKLIVLLIVSIVVSIGLTVGVAKYVLHIKPAPEVLPLTASAALPTAAPPPPPPVASPTPPTPPAEMFVPVAAVYALGYVRAGKHVRVCLSDGTVLSDMDNTDKDKPRLTRVTSTFVEFDGKRAWFRKPPPPQATAPPPIAPVVAAAKENAPVSEPQIPEETSQNSKSPVQETPNYMPASQTRAPVKKGVTKVTHALQ